MRIVLETLGCKLNRAETESIARQFVEAGHQLVSQAETADIYILNTCTVTGTADSKSRQLLRSARRRYPSAAVVAVGCYAQRAPSELVNVDGVNFVVGNDGKTTILKQLRDANLLDNKLPMPNPSFPGQYLTLRTRAFVKIQNGCCNFCAYCIVPFVRTAETSVPCDEVVNQVKQRTDEGYQEVVLTGTRIGAYSSGGIGLRGLIENILKETEIPRLRLSSLQPREIDKELISLWQDKRLCPHFHLSLQSGSERVLSRMKRRYTIKEYEHLVAMIRSELPAVAITTDVIVGFPGETDEEFTESLEFCRRMEFARIHVFPYSPRSGTEAAGMNGQIPDVVKKERKQQMLALAKESASRFRAKFSGKTLEVLWEKQTGKGVWSGMTGNYIRVFKKDDGDLTNKLGEIKLT